MLSSFHSLQVKTMKFASGNIWEFHNEGEYITVTINRCLRSNGFAVMGAGIAKQARIRFPEIESVVGAWIKSDPQKLVYRDDGYKMLFVVTKYDWRFNSSYEIVKNSTIELLKICQNIDGNVHVVPFGAGMGGLDLKTVVSIMGEILDDKYICHNNKDV